MTQSKNLGSRVRQVRKNLIEEHHRHFFAVECTQHGTALLILLTRRLCGHIRFVEDWQQCKPCWLCEHEYHKQRTRELMIEFGIDPDAPYEGPPITQEEIDQLYAELDESDD